MSKPKTFVYVQSDLDRSPSVFLPDMVDQIVTARLDDILADMEDIHRNGCRVVGAWKITVEKVDPKIWRTWNRVARKKAPND